MASAGEVLTKDFELANADTRLLKKIAISTTAGVSTLGASYVDGGTLTDAAAVTTLVLQADQDFFFELTSGATAVTDYSGSRPGRKVLAGQEVWVRNVNGYTGIDVKGVASGTLTVRVPIHRAGM